MRSPFAIAVVGAIFATLSFAQPAITGVANNYSYIQPGMPNYGIAQGSIFDIFGTGLAGTTTPLEQVPLATALDGVTIAVTVNVATTHPTICRRPRS
jgi:hypothetical protein